VVERLHAKFHLNAFIVSASGDQKPQFWAKCDILGAGGSCTDPLLTMMARFGVLQQTHGVHLPEKFHLHVFIASAFGGQKLQFLANFDTLGGSCTDPLLPMTAQFGVL